MAVLCGAALLAAVRDAPPAPAAFVEPPSEARERADWFYRQRAYPAEQTPPNALRTAAREARTLKSLAAADSDAGAPELSWTSIGPTPLTGSWRGSFGTSPGAGRVPALAPVGDGTTAYLGGAQGGVWKTVDGGVTWTPIFDSVIGAGEAGMAIGALAVDPASPSTVYAGTGEASLMRSYFGSGIFRTTNGGAAWTKIGGATFDSCHVSDLRIKGGTILAAVVRAGRWTRSCLGGVYRSTNGGATWARTLDDTATQPSPTHTVNVGAFDISPGSGSTWFATVWGDDPASTGGPVFRSSDDGATWTRLAGGLRTTENGRSTVAAAPSDPTRVYAVTTSTRFDNWGNLTGIFVSSDGGATWESRTLPNSEVEGTPCANGVKTELRDPLTTYGQCDYDQELIVDPTDPDTVYFAGITLWRSTDAGVTWSLVDGDPTGYDVHLDYHALAFDSAGRLWVGTDGGVWRSADDGADWTNLNATLSLVQFEWGIAGQADADGPLYGGTQDQATNRRNPDGSWSRLLGGDGGAMAWHPAEPNILYACVYYGVYAKTTDGGNSWVTDTRPWDGSAADHWNFHPPMVMSPTDRETLFFASTRVWRTTDGADSWQPISPHFGSDNRSSISALGVTTDPDVLYAGSNDGQLRVTQDGAATWTATQANGLPNRTFSEVEAKPGAPETAYVAASGFDPNGGTGHVFKTTDLGASWTNLSGNLPNTPVNAIAIDWRTSPETLYVGTDVGVLWSYDGGQSWHNTSAGLPPIVVMDVKLDLSANKLIAATHGRGMYTAPVVTPPPMFSIADASLTEGDSGTANMTFTVDVVPAGSAQVEVDYATANGTATAGSDFIATSGTLTIPAGQQFGTVTVPVHGDATYEQNEGFSVTLTGVSANAAIGDGQASGTISDDDPLPTVSVADAEVTEGNAGTTNLEFTLTLSGATKFQPRIEHLTQEDSATGEDFVQLTDDSQTLFDPNGPPTQTRTVLVAVRGDTAAEGDERFRFYFSAVDNAQPGRASAWGWIRNDDSSAPPPPPPPPAPPPPAPPASPPPPPAAPRRCVVPNLVGRSLSAAKARIRGARCRVGKVTYRRAARRNANRVLAQRPAPGRRLASGARINLVVGRR